MRASVGAKASSPAKHQVPGAIPRGASAANPAASSLQDGATRTATFELRQPGTYMHSQTMKLRVTRPGFIEGIRRYKASQGIQDYDVNEMATRQEIRTFVCGQCHVEYYFHGEEKRLT